MCFLWVTPARSTAVKKHRHSFLALLFSVVIFKHAELTASTSNHLQKSSLRNQWQKQETHKTSWITTTTYKVSHFFCLENDRHSCRLKCLNPSLPNAPQDHQQCWFMSVSECWSTGNAQVIKIPGYMLQVTSCQNWGLYHSSIFSFKSTRGWAGIFIFLHKHNNLYILQLRTEIFIRYSYLCWSLLNKELSQFQCSSSIFCRIMPKLLFTLNLLPRASKLGVQAGYLFFHTDQHPVFSKLDPFRAK